MKHEDVVSGARGEHPHKSHAGPVRIWRAFFYSMAGLRSAWVAESAFRQKLVLVDVFVVAR